MGEPYFSSERGLPGSAWETWREAGAACARWCAAESVVEEAHRYAAGTGSPHPYVVRRAFMDGFRNAKGGA